MPQRYKLTRWELAAVILAAVFVLAPLLVMATPGPMINGQSDSQRHYESQQCCQSPFFILWGPNILGAITIAVLVFQAIIFNRQAGISERQVKLMQTFPDIYPLIDGQNFTASINLSPGMMDYIETDPDTFLGETPQIVYRLRNFGKAPAILRSVIVTIKIDDAIPSESFAIAPNDLPKKYILAERERTEPLNANLAVSRKRMRKEAFGALKRGKRYIWFVGAIRFDRLTGERDQLNFCWRYEHTLQRFEPYPPERNYIERDIQRQDTPPNENLDA